LWRKKIIAPGSLSAYLLIPLAALVTAGLTLFSGFGLGTLFLPVFALFFPLEVAIAATAVVHLANNLFKVALLGKYADRGVILRFGLPAIAAAYLGARSLVWLGELPPLLTYHWGGRTLEVAPVKLVVAVLMVGFALLEAAPAGEKFTLERKFLPLGGVLSGFFGGLSGHQGALRSACLLRCGLGKESFIGTGAAIATLVDLSRLAVYIHRFFFPSLQAQAGILAAAVAAALTGTFTGSRLLGRVTFRSIRILVSVLLGGVALGLATGLL